MNRYKYIAEIFEKPPLQWGLRGDPYLWRELQFYFSSTPIPNTISEFNDHLEQSFLLLSGQSVSTLEDFQVEKFGHGGMSSGFICSKFWREIAIPLLKERFNEIESNP